MVPLAAYDNKHVHQAFCLTAGHMSSLLLCSVPSDLKCLPNVLLCLPSSAQTFLLSVCLCIDLNTKAFICHCH